MLLLTTFFSLLKRLDKLIFLFINHDSDSKVLDPVMITLRNPYTWIPFYAFLLLYSVRKMKKNAVLFISISILVVAITDIACYTILKPYFERLRPCHDPELKVLIRTLVDCGGSYSFPSNHAANHFGLATFWFYYIRKMTGRKWYWLGIWAFLIGYAQVYVGKHFPADILAGAIVGVLTGWIVFRLTNYGSGPGLIKRDSN